MGVGSNQDVDPRLCRQRLYIGAVRHSWQPYDGYAQCTLSSVPTPPGGDVESVLRQVDAAQQRAAMNDLALGPVDV